MIRLLMTPDEFDANARQLERRNPGISLTSGKRSEWRNAAVGGHRESKHLIAMARDYRCENDEDKTAALADAVRSGFWTKPYEWGFHIQGLPPGEIAAWWTEKYGGQ